MQQIVTALAVVGGLVLALGNQAWTDEKIRKTKDEAKDKIEMAAASSVEASAR